MVRGLAGCPSNHDLLGRQTGTLPRPEEWHYELSYDADGNLSQISAPLGKTVSFGYDLAGRVTSKIFADGQQVRFQYDANGNLGALAQPGSPPWWLPGEVHQFGSESRDLLASYGPPDIGLGLDITTYDYSADRELELVSRPDGQLVDPVYDAGGQLIGLGVPGGSVGYTYGPPTDPTAPGKLVSVTSTLDAETLYFGYAGALLTSSALMGPVSGTVDFTYDDDLRVSSETAAGAPVSFTYGDADGLLGRKGWGEKGTGYFSLPV